MAHDVFISYSTKNKDVADAVCDKLESNDIPCWIAPRNIKTGTNYAEEIMDGLNTSKIVVLVFSKDAQESEYVNNEIDNAFTKGKCIVAIKVDDTFPKDKLEFFLKNTQWLDASPTALKEENKTIESCYDQLVGDVQRVLTGKPCPKGGLGSHRIPVRKKSFFEQHKWPIISALLILIAVGGILAFNSMGSDSNSDDLNETAISIGYIGIEDNGDTYSYYVFGTVNEQSNISDDVVHIDYYDDTGKIIDTSDTKIGDIKGNILGSIDISEKNVNNISAKLQDKNDKVLYKVDSDNVIEQ